MLAPGGPLEIARELQAAGRIGHIGVTSHNLGLAVQMAKDNHFETLMFPFNFITHEPLEELIPLCHQNDIGFIAMKPVGGGMLWDIEVAFKWLRQTPGIVPLVGMQSLDELAQNLAVMEGPAQLTAEEMALIARRREELGTRFCRACDYCQPCPQAHCHLLGAAHPEFLPAHARRTLLQRRHSRKHRHRRDLPRVWRMRDALPL